ncbi:MAG: dTMP kinase [Candidatus Aenigmatarchaeota archaeon]
MKGKFFAIEGLDGAGGTTHSKKLARHLRAKGIDAVWMEYTGTPGNPVARLIDDYLHKKLDFSPQALFMLFSALHTQSTEKIKKLLAQGKTVVLDRYFPSALAYQCAQGVDLKTAKGFVQELALKPDAILFLKVSPETGFKRKKGQDKDIDRFEQDLQLQQKVSDIYEGLAAENFLGPWFIVDTEGKGIPDGLHLLALAVMPSSPGLFLDL